MANKKSKLSRLENQILEARVYVKRGLYESFYVQDGSVYLIPYPNRSYEDEVCFYCAKNRISKTDIYKQVKSEIYS